MVLGTSENMLETKSTAKARSSTQMDRDMKVKCYHEANLLAGGVGCREAAGEGRPGVVGWTEAVGAWWHSSPWSRFCCFPFLTSPSSDEHGVVYMMILSPRASALGGILTSAVVVTSVLRGRVMSQEDSCPLT